MNHRDSEGTSSEKLSANNQQTWLHIRHTQQRDLEPELRWKTLRQKLRFEKWTENKNSSNSLVLEFVLLFIDRYLYKIIDNNIIYIYICVCVYVYIYI